MYGGPKLTKKRKRGGGGGGGGGGRGRGEGRCISYDLMSLASPSRSMLLINTPLPVFCLGMKSKLSISHMTYQSSPCIVNVEVAVIRTGNETSPGAIPGHSVHLETQGSMLQALVFPLHSRRSPGSYLTFELSPQNGNYVYSVQLGY